jgi:uncharacterized membrane protein
MPYVWVEEPDKAPERSGAFSFADGDPPMARLRLWPHRSLTAPGFAWFIGITAAMVALPLIASLGSPTLWGLLPFILAAVAGIWWALRRNARDGALNEVLTLWRDRVELVRTDPRGHRQDWAAEPYWVKVGLHESGGPVEQYLTLKGGGREVEIGRFLSPEERVALRGELTDMLARVR